MFVLKEYQQRTLDVLHDYFAACVRLDDADLAFYEITKRTFGSGIPYRAVKELPGLPYVCLRIPTGGGKTIVACHAVGVATGDLLHADRCVVLWLVPSNAIREQTLQALKDRTHPYRQALDSALGPIRVIGVSEALYVQRATLDTETTIIVSTMQAFRVDDTDGRKVYESSGALMAHFSGLPDGVLSTLERREDGSIEYSLANVLRIRRPVVIVDEAHNARTALSFETLARFKPSCILEFTATPDTEDNPSNVLHSVSAAELKAEAMIKIPIRLETRTDWKELLADAVGLRSLLEAVAQQERQATGEYIRPIMLIQAQPKRKDQNTLTVNVVEQSLIDDFRIPKEGIARATASDKDLDGVDLSDPQCPIRFVITVQALREGWDCPFAYVLCSVAEMRSSTAVEQILGRVMRLPGATPKQHGDLNIAYAFAVSQSFAEAANALADALVENGFNRQEAKELITPAPIVQSELPLSTQTDDTEDSVKIAVSENLQVDALPTHTAAKITYDQATKTITAEKPLNENDWEALMTCLSTPEAKTAIAYHRQKWRDRSAKFPRTPSERGELFTIPVLAIKQGDLFEPFEETHFLETPWSLSECSASLTEEEFSSKRPEGQVGEIVVTDKGRVEYKFLSSLHQQMTLLATDMGWTVSELVHWLDRAIPHPDITPTESGIFLTRLAQSLIDDRGLSLDSLVHDKYRLKHAVAAKMDQHRRQARHAAYQALLLPDCATPLTVAPDVCFSFSPSDYPYSRLYRGAYKFQKHYYPQVGDLDNEGEEFECARFIDLLLEVKFWVRNLERRPTHSFWLQTSTDKFYPDFVCLLKDGRYLVVEYKGADRWSNDDSKEKRNMGGLWEVRSGGKCLFIMPKGKDLGAIKAKID